MLNIHRAPGREIVEATSDVIQQFAEGWQAEQELINSLVDREPETGKAKPRRRIKPRSLARGRGAPIPLAEAQLMVARLHERRSRRRPNRCQGCANPAAVNVPSGNERMPSVAERIDEWIRWGA